MSRARRIVLAMYGQRKPEAPVYSDADRSLHSLYRKLTRPYAAPCAMDFGHSYAGNVVTVQFDGRRCYEAMDDVDPITADLPRSPIVGGNFGLPCA